MAINSLIMYASVRHSLARRNHGIMWRPEMLITVADYNNEISRVQAALDKTTSPKQRRDYGKYLARLKKELHSAQERERRRRERWQTVR